MRILKQVQTYSEWETEEFAFRLAQEQIIKKGAVVALEGTLGAGKTAFVRGLVRYFDAGVTVQSPTYAIVNEYEIKPDGENSPGKILHFDVYRITSEEDLLSIAFFDYPFHENITIIEWYSNISAYVDVSLYIELSVISASSRLITLYNV